MGIKELHKQFCEEYLVLNNGVAAYQKVYPGCKKSTAGANSNALLKRSDVSEYLEELRTNLRNKKIWELDDILKDLKTIAEDTKNSKNIRLVAYAQGTRILTPQKAAIHISHSGQVDSSVTSTSLSAAELQALIGEE